MQYEQLTYIHLATMIPVAFLGAYLLITLKGTAGHKAIGKIYMLLMFFSSLVSLFMPAKVGPTLLFHFGAIHLLSFLAITMIIFSFIAVKVGNIALHKRSMVGLYVGGIIVAGSFTLTPGRLLHDWIF